VEGGGWGWADDTDENDPEDETRLPTVGHKAVRFAAVGVSETLRS